MAFLTSIPVSCLLPYSGTGRKIVLATYIMQVTFTSLPGAAVSKVKVLGNLSRRSAGVVFALLLLHYFPRYANTLDRVEAADSDVSTWNQNFISLHFLLIPACICQNQT